MADAVLNNDRQVSLSDVFSVFLKIGILSFGGPAAQISLMHKLVVEERRWISEKQFLNALSFCMLLPGPEAMQLATYTGWKLRGWPGGLISGLLFVLPGALVILILASIYAYYGDAPLVASLFNGIKAAVFIVVIEALFRISRKALHSKFHWGVALIAFVSIYFLAVPFPLIILVAGFAGTLFGAFRREGAVAAPLAKVSRFRTLQTVIVWMLVWWVPVLFVMIFSEHQILSDIATFFSRLAVVTFGGAYAVLAYMGQDVVNQLAWLKPGEMIDGLGLAETTPGPLILVTQFVGFLAAFREGGIWLGLAGAGLTLWVTFTPCFLWIFTGAPYLEWISTQKRLAGALEAISAAVVGVMLNLSLWFGLHVYFDDVTLERWGILKIWVPALSGINWSIVFLSVACGFLLLFRHWNIISVLLLASLAGLAWEI